MLLNEIKNNVWLAIGIWAAMFCIDYLLTIKVAKMWQAGASKHLVFSQGYELNPIFRNDVDKLRWFSYRLILLSILYGGMLLIIHSAAIPNLFAFTWGMIVGLQLAVMIRHARNLTIFYYLGRSEGVEGKIRYDHWLNLRISSVEFFAFSILFLALFALWGEYFALGAALGCLILGLRHLKDSLKERSRSIQAEA